MSTKVGIGYSPLTDKIYLGMQNKEKRMWTGTKDDITNEFISISFEYFKEGSIREITNSNDDSNLFINTKNEKKELLELIKNLIQRVEMF